MTLVTILLFLATCALIKNSWHWKYHRTCSMLVCLTQEGVLSPLSAAYSAHVAWLMDKQFLPQGREEAIAFGYALRRDLERRYQKSTVAALQEAADIRWKRRQTLLSADRMRAVVMALEPKE